MTTRSETRLLQAAIIVACLVPLYAGGTGMLFGADMMRGVDPPVAIDLDSHFRYLSGLLFGIGLGFLGCVPGITRQTIRFRLLGGIVIVGGIGRLVGLIALGPPGGAHLFALVMELGVVPLLLVWQYRVARRHASSAIAQPDPG